jgi:hypothetical protein
MPQITQQATSSAVKRQVHGDRSSNGHRNPNGHPPSNGHGPTSGDGQPAPVETDRHLEDVPALLAEIEGLGQRLARQAVVEQAKGILMGYYSIDSDTAFQLLCRWSQNTNTKLRHIAEQLTDTITHHTDSRPAPHQIVQQDLPPTQFGHLAQTRSW